MNNETPETKGAPSPVQPVKSSRTLWRFFSNPLVGMIGALASVISVGLAIYIFNESREFPQLTYYVYPVKASVLKAGQASKLTCNFEDKSVNSDISVAQIAIWNQGKRPIKKENILKPVVLYTTNGAPILEATIRRQSRDVVHLELDRNDLQKGRVIVSWAIAEQNDGGVIQLIYLGSSEISIGLDGVIEGQGILQRVDFSGTIESAEQQYKSHGQERVVSYIFIVTGLFCVVGSLMVVMKSPKSKGLELIFLLFASVFGLSLTAWALFDLMRHYVGPPFGFD